MNDLLKKVICKYLNLLLGNKIKDIKKSVHKQNTFSESHAFTQKMNLGMFNSFVKKQNPEIHHLPRTNTEKTTDLVQSMNSGLTITESVIPTSYSKLKTNRTNYDEFLHSQTRKINSFSSSRENILTKRDSNIQKFTPKKLTSCSPRRSNFNQTANSFLPQVSIKTFRPVLGNPMRDIKTHNTNPVKYVAVRKRRLKKRMVRCPPQAITQRLQKFL